MKRALTLFMLGAVSYSCASDEADVAPDEALPEQAIFAGTAGVRSGVVEIRAADYVDNQDGSCSGVLVGPHVMLTASHCLGEHIFGGTGRAKARTEISVQTMDTGGVWHCASDTSENPDGTCVNQTRASAARTAQTNPRADGDFAVVVHQRGWRYTPPSYPKLTTTIANGESYTLYGRGPTVDNGSDSGFFHFLKSKFSGVGAESVSSVAGPVRTCHGDSGGPYFVRTRVGALHVSSDQHDDRCGSEGTTFRGTRITPAKIELINELLRDHQLPECQQLNDDDWTCA